MDYLSINNYKEYIRNGYLSPTEYKEIAQICLDPIQGISYNGILYNEICSDSKMAFVTMPFMSADELCTSDRLICSNTTTSRLCTLIMAYHVFNRDYTIPVLAYLLAKTMTMKNGYEFEITALLPSEEIERLNSRISNEDGKHTDIASEVKTIFMEAIESKKIPWLKKSERFKIGFAISETEAWIKKIDNNTHV